MVVRGMILGRAFPVALTTRQVTINQDMKALLPHAPSTSEFLLLALRAFEPAVLSSIERSSHGTCKLLTGVLHSFEIPIPPLAEQRRIVAKVDELMAMVDHLESKQMQRDQLAEAFAKACVASFTGTTTPKKSEKMKAPKTELVSLVSLGIKPKADADAPLAGLLIKQDGELSAKALWQQSGLEIDAFYHQLKSEIAHGWIVPQSAEMKIVETEEEPTYSTLVPALAATDVGGEEPTKQAKQQRKRK
jgi:type I restriction enzyme S subunit